MKRILVIDDDLNIQEMLEGVLSELGYQVDVAGDGNQAIKRVNQNKPDLIIMDVRLPDIDGVSLCREIHRLKETSEIPIFMLTALSDLATYHDAKLFGAVDYIVKPFDLDLLRGKIKKVLSE